MFQSGEAGLQKKAYMCLEVTLSVTSPDHQKFREERLPELMSLLVESLSMVSAGSKKVRHLHSDPRPVWR